MKMYSEIYSKFTGEHQSRGVISIKLLRSFIETTLRDGCSPVNLFHIFRTTFLRTPMEGWLFSENMLQGSDSKQVKVKEPLIQQLCSNK